MFACGGGNICYNNVMNRVVSFLQKYFAVISVLIGISILLSVTFSSYIVTSNNHKAAEMYIGELKYSMEIDGTATNTLMVPTGETIIDVKVNNLNPVDTYYKLLYLKNTNITIKYYESTKDTNDVVTTYNKPNDSITSSNSNIIKLLITNNSTSSQNIALTMKGGYITNTIQDITTPSTYSEITLVETPSTNTYFCKTNSTLTQGLKYVNGQYTYAYKQEGKNTNDVQWQDMTSDGWGVQLTDKSSTDAVTSKLCTYVNDKPIVSLAYMFRISSLSSATGASSFDLSSFNTSNVTDMRSMFSGAKATTLDISNLDTSNVANMSYMFGNLKNVTSLDLSNLNTSNVTDMSGMFFATNTTYLNLSDFDTSKVTSMNKMFSHSKVTTLDLRNFDTSRVTDMSSMFESTNVTTLDLGNFDTSKVTNMSSMFESTNVTILDLGNFDTSKVTNMETMFQWSSATVIDLSSFDTSKVTNMSNMFRGSSSTSAPLKIIYASSKFVTTAVTNSTSMFYNCSNLVGGAGTKYNSSYIDKTYAHIDGGTSNPGYFTDIADKANEPNSFATDSWKTIIKAVKDGNTGKYNVGDTKEITLDGYGTHTLRIANMSTPSECSTSGFSQTACGFVLEFADIITTRTMNDTMTNVGSWPATAMRTFLNADIYNLLPSDLKNGIINTMSISGHGNTSGETNFTSTDKLYLLSTAEVWSQGSSNTIDYDTARDATRQLDYYKNLGVSTTNLGGAIKKDGNTASIWWLRNASSIFTTTSFYGILASGDWGCNMRADDSYGVSPAFRIG